jgi:tetratricopeptide (TPR) repeat protein
MKRLIEGIFIIIIAIILSLACNRRIAPSSSKGSEISGYDSTKFDYVFTEALKQKFLGNAGDALKYLEQCIILNPGSDAAYYEMSQICLMVGDVQRGKNYALKAQTINRNNVWYQTLVANLYYQQKNIDSAIYYYEAAVKLNPEKEDLKFNLAHILSENHNYKKASEIYSFLEKKYGINENTTLSAVRNLINAGDFKEAEIKIKKLLEQSPDVIMYNGLLAEIYAMSGERNRAAEIYRKLIENNPKDPQVQISICEFLINEKQYEDLFDILKTVTINDSIGRDEKLTIYSRIMSDSSVVNKYARNLELCLIIFEATYKEDGLIVLLRPDLYVTQKKYTNAIKRLEEIIKIQPQNYFAWEKLLILYSEVKDWESLYARGEECSTNFNRAFLPKILYANAAIEKEKYDIAEEELRRANILAGSDTDKLIQVLVMNADVFYKKKDFEKSFDSFKEALNMRPTDVLILNNYAYYLAEQNKDLKDAEKMAKYVVENEKENPTYLDTYAWVLYKKGRYKEAEKIMEAIIKTGSNEDAAYYEHLGFIQKALKKCDKAIENWNTAFRLDNRKSALQKEIENCVKH